MVSGVDHLIHNTIVDTCNCTCLYLHLTNKLALAAIKSSATLKVSHVAELFIYPDIYDTYPFFFSEKIIVKDAKYGSLEKFCTTSSHTWIGQNFFVSQPLDESVCRVCLGGTYEPDVDDGRAV